MTKLKFLDLFAGIGGFHSGMEKAGHECVGFCEWDKYATASYTSMYLITEEQRKYLATLDLKKRQKEILKEEYRNGIWYSNDIRDVTGRSVPRADIWCFGAPCFTAGNLVTTSEGMKPIEDVKSGDMVLTHKNRFRKVVAPMVHTAKGICTLKVQGSLPTECTANHRFYVRYKTIVGNKSKQGYYFDFVWTEPEWKAVGEFIGKEYILFPKNPLSTNEKEIEKQDNGEIVDGLLWMPVKQVTFEPDRVETVYNLEVEEDNAYTINNMGCHNCQSFSLAGKRAGLEGESGLIREVFRILGEIEEADRPRWIIYENVKGMFSSNRGFDYLAILLEMESLGYDIEWQLFNTKDFGIPQNRERVYTVGSLRRYGPSKIFPISRTDEENHLYEGEGSKEISLIGHREGFHRNLQTYDVNGITETLDTSGGGGREFNVALPLDKDSSLTFKSLSAPNNFKHKAGDGMETRERTETQIHPSLQANTGSTQATYANYEVSVYDSYNHSMKDNATEVGTLGTNPGNVEKCGCFGIVEPLDKKKLNLT